MLHRNPLKSDELNQGIENLMRKYEGAKNGSGRYERRNIIKLIQSFNIDKDKEYNYMAALGACVYGLININGDFGLFIPPIKESFLKHYFDYGSKLSKSLQDFLNISYANPLDDQKALVYLTAFYHHIKKFPRHSDGLLAKDKESNNLVKDIEKYIKILLLQIAKKRPTYNALTSSYAEIPEIYKELGGSDAERGKYTQFTRVLDKVLGERYQKESKEDKEWSDSYAMRYAALLFAMETIKREKKYGWWLLSPDGRLNTGSALYKACKKALNINYDIQEIPDDYKRKYYFHLLAYVTNVNLRDKELEKWEKEGFKDAKKFFENLQNALAERVVDLIRKTKPGAISLSYVDIVTSTAASYGVSIALGKIATEVSLRGTALTCFNLLKPEAALLITLLMFAMKSIVTQRVSDAVNTVIINTISQPVIITFSGAKKLGEFCYSLFASEIEPHSMEVTDDDEFMEALHSLPNDFFTPEIADKLKYAVAYHRKTNTVVAEDKEVIQAKLM